jgi:hypothetical protein
MSLHRECIVQAANSLTNAAAGPDTTKTKLEVWPILFLSVGHLHNPNIIMKYFILIICVLLTSPAANAAWFSSTSDPIPEYKEKIASLETQLSAQALTLNRWQIATGSLGIACVVLLVIGTALGAQTRKNYDGPTRRMGPTPPASTGLNGRKSRIVGKAAQENSHTTLAA